MTSLVGKGPVLGMAEEVLRRGAETFHSAFGNCDPFVPLSSGVLEGSSRHQVMTWPNFDHMDIVTRREVWQEVLSRLQVPPAAAD